MTEHGKSLHLSHLWLEIPWAGSGGAGGGRAPRSQLTRRSQGGWRHLSPPDPDPRPEGRRHTVLSAEVVQSLGKLVLLERQSGP